MTKKWAIHDEYCQSGADEPRHHGHNFLDPMTMRLRATALPDHRCPKFLP